MLTLYLDQHGTFEGKVTQLYSEFDYEQIVKWCELLPLHVQLRFLARVPVAEREQPRVHQKV